MEMYLQHLCNEYRNSIEVAEFLSKDIIATINNRENDEKGSCIKSGYLFKKNNFMGWRTKYFILNEKDISFYESKGGDLNGTINLKHAKVISVSNKEKFHHAFRIIEYKDEKGVIAKTAEDKIYAKHLLCSENDNDRDEWVTKIKSVIDKLKRENESVASLMNSNNNVLSKSNNNSFDVNKSHDSSINEINKEQYIESKDTIKEGAETHNDDNKELENKINDNNELENKINDNSNNNENENDNNENINNENNNENGNGNNNNRNNEDSGDNNIESPSSNNNGWDSSDEEEDVDIILDYDEKNYIPEGFNFEEFEKQGIDINEYIKNKSRKNSNENNNEDDGKKVNDDTNDHNNEDENYNENNENNEYTENENPKSDVIDDNERVMKQTIPPPLVPKSTVAYERNEKLKVGKEEKQRKIHFSWYKFKKNTNSVNDIDNKDLDKNKKVFGVNLETAIKNSKIKDDYELPAIVYRCIEYLDAKGAYEEEGIYRLSGSKATIQSLKNRFDRYGDVNLLQDKEIYDVHVITGLLKLYLRELPTTIMTKEFQPRFIEIASIPDREEKVVALANLISYLPLANYTLLRCLAAHLVRIVQNSELNKMTLSNIAIVFGPTLGIPIGLFVLILSEFEAVFCWTTLKESEEEENIMSILFSGPEDYLNVHSVSKAQKDARNKLQLQNKMEHSSPVLFNENQQNEKDVDQSLRDTDNHSSENSDSEVPEITSDDLITGSFKVRGRSNTNVQKNNNYKNIQAIKEESTTRDQLSLSEEVVNLINEKCKNINMESDKEKLETILDAENLQNEFRRRRKERCSSLFVSSQSQIDYVKSLRRLSCGESSIKEVINRNSQDYMIGIPDNFRLSEMFAKEIKIKDNEEIINSKNVEYDHALAQ
ncbi:RhoGAP-domain-containing protein [Neocallimastix lanati (nom. inval.)]|nr:RhoGAP-domain-containing protein [Neocallimastix sp. JGI-2020a]